MNPAVRMIKVGGSLLDWADLVPTFRRWLSLQSEAVNVVIVGGGPIVDALRKLDARHSLGDDAAHWLAVRAMRLTAELFACLLDGVAPATRLDQLCLTDTRSAQVLDVELFLRQDASAPAALPCGWHVTSDSIAARAASVLEAKELALLKSVLPSCPSTLEAWSRAGIVDPFFLRAAAGLRVRLINLRDDEFPEAQPA